MRKKYTLLWAIFLFIAMTAALSLLLLTTDKVLAKSGDAMITDIRGNVILSSSGKEQKANLLLNLKSGDILKGSKGSKLTVTFFSDGHTETINNDFSVKVEKSGLSILKGVSQSNKTNPIKKKQTGLKIVVVETEKPGSFSMRAGPDTFSASPDKNEAVDTPTPDFKWESLSKQNYLFIVKATDMADGKYELIEPKIKIKEDGLVIYPQNRTPLEYGKTYGYYLSEKAGYNENAEPYIFNVLPKKEIDLLKELEEKAKELTKENPDDVSPLVSLMTVYYGKKVYKKAIEQAKKIIELRPDDVGIHMMLLNIYTDLGWKNKEFINEKTIIENLNKKQEAKK